MFKHKINILYMYDKSHQDSSTIVVSILYYLRRDKDILKGKTKIKTLNWKSEIKSDSQKQTTNLSHITIQNQMKQNEWLKQKKFEAGLYILLTSYTSTLIFAHTIRFFFFLTLHCSNKNFIVLNCYKNCFTMKKKFAKLN